MGRFLVPASLSVFRPGLGLFKAGAVITLPDAASKPGEGAHLSLIPLDKEAHELLEYTAERVIEAEEQRLAGLAPPQKMSENAKKAIRARVNPVPSDPEGAASPPVAKDETMTLRQFAEGKGPMQPPAKGGRAADR